MRTQSAIPGLVETLYNGDVSAHTISNPVPTPEEMGEILGLGSERVNVVRRIMSTPNTPKASRSGRKALRGVDRVHQITSLPDST